MIQIKLNEDKFNNVLLKEARMEGFRVDTLRNLSYKDKVNYCKKMLGEPIGNGSSRMVFQLDDETVLKIAKNRKGLAQNEQEANLSQWTDDQYTPQVLNGSDENDFIWIVAEYVLPAKAADFKKLLGMDFKDIRRFIFGVAIPKYYKAYSQPIAEKYKDNYQAVEVLSMLQDLYYSYNIEIGDFSRISNWGLVIRDGKPTIVVLDVGLSKDVFDSFYSR